MNFSFELKNILTTFAPVNLFGGCGFKRKNISLSNQESRRDLLKIRRECNAPGFLFSRYFAGVKWCRVV